MYCSKCGSEISATTAFCSTCGQAISGAVPATPSLSPVDPNQYAPAAPASYGGVEYAGFWLRFVAYIIDGVISGLAFLVLLVPLFILTGAGAALSKISSGEDISDDVATFWGSGFHSSDSSESSFSSTGCTTHSRGKFLMASHVGKEDAKSKGDGHDRSADYLWPGFGPLLRKNNHRQYDSAHDRLHPSPASPEKSRPFTT